MNPAETKLIISVAKPHDLPALAQMLGEAAAEYVALDPGSQALEYRDWNDYARGTLSHPEGAVLVARTGDLPEIRGFIELKVPAAALKAGRSRWRRLARAVLRRPSVRPTERANTTGYVANIYVSPALRRRGVASGLLRAAGDWFGHVGVRQVEASVLEGNGASLSLFEKHGYLTVRRTLRKQAGEAAKN